MAERIEVIYKQNVTDPLGEGAKKSIKDFLDLEIGFIRTKQVYTVDIDLIGILEEVRQHFMKPVTITSGCRCANHNYRIGGAKDSQHIYGRAADIQVKDTPPEKVYEFIDGRFQGLF